MLITFYIIQVLFVNFSYNDSPLRQEEISKSKVGFYCDDASQN